MATLRFLTKGKANPTTIYLRFLNGRKFDFHKSTSLLIDPKDWNNSKGCVKNNKNLHLQNTLNLLKTHILGDYNNSYTNGVRIDSAWLTESLGNFLKSNERIIEKVVEIQKSTTELTTKFNYDLQTYKPFKPAVYFLMSADEIVYIGKTTSLPNRISAHLTESVKCFDEILYIDLLESQLDEVEQKLIKYYKPKYNIQYL